ncbi:TolC family protein [Spectribacter hydrogenoxidans]|uniref:TolC family protein n=1 Tax=Spectribacter hydrogenoxidans TaxID=3075608 RepID=A0ABU3C402_9GAMM|nr:TolC family protein [Salinisphaera sp. W335]MDT0636111.1 TolC family protein [Salinisphaera sp. W335]
MGIQSGWPRAIVTAAAAVLFTTSTAALADSLQPDDLVKQVLAGNPGVAALEAAVKAAEARIGPAGSLPDPELRLAVAPRTVDGFTTPAGQHRGVSGIVEISQSLPWPGTLGLRADVARHEAAAAGDEVASLRLRLAAATRSRYAEWFYVHRALAINASNQQLTEELRRVAERRYATGLAEQQDVLQAEVELQRLREQALVLEQRRAAIRARTNALLSREADAPLPAPADMPAADPLPAYASLRALALRRHPALQRLDRRIAASRDREALADKAFYPDLRVMAGNNDFRPASETRFTVGVGISLPLDQDKRRAARDAARADTMRLDFEHRDQRNRLLGELEAARAAAEQARASIDLYRRELVPRTQESLSAARAAYGSGGGSFLAVITAEQQQLDAELNLARARADYFIARAELARWAGGELPDPAAAGNPETNP